MDKNKFDAKSFQEAIHDKSNVAGFTHDFYNYPARFSPNFVREAIRTFSKPGDLIIDPFVGGGTTLVEAKLLNRNSIGLDISSLATFIAKTKTTSLSLKQIDEAKNWGINVANNLDCQFTSENQSQWKDAGYHRNISEKSTWRIKNIIEHFISEIENSRLLVKQQNFLRCSILKTGQWALDNKKTLPNIASFRSKLSSNIEQMAKGAKEFTESLANASDGIRSICINQPSSEIAKLKEIKSFDPPALILTSPPYPGVHVVYHRWQIQGRKETPAPFWIANSLDGHGLSYYAMGGRQQKGLETYFANILKSFCAIKKVCSKDTLIIQMVAFSDITWQLPKYLDVMNMAGFEEVQVADNRIWRKVPSRKWYAQIKDSIDSANEVVLFHKLIS